jgi:hypothetical protein
MEKSEVDVLRSEVERLKTKLIVEDDHLSGINAKLRALLREVAECHPTRLPVEVQIRLPGDLWDRVREATK